MPLTGFLQDLRIAIKQMRSTPGLALVSVLMLSIGIGASTSVFAALNRVILNPLPIRDIDRLVVFNAPGPPGQDALRYWSQLGPLSALCSYESGGVTDSDAPFPTRISAAVVSPSFFAVTEAVPRMGRQFVTADDESGSNNIAIISHHLWEENYGGDSSVLGRTLRLDGVPHRIVGIMPEGFRYPERTDVWISRSSGGSSLSLGQDELDMPGLFRWGMLGRLRDDATLAQCQAEVDGLFEQIKTMGGSPGDPVRLLTLRDLVVRDHRSAFLGLLAAAASLLLISLANASNLQLTRAVAREKDTSIRVCLGARPAILIRFYFAEALLTALAAGALGLLLAYGGVAVVRVTGQRYLPSLADLRVSAVGLVFSIILSSLVALAIELRPIRRALSKDPLDSLKDNSGRAVTDVRRHAGEVAAVTEVALALILLITAMLTIGTVLRLSDTEAGIDPKGLISMSIELPESKYGVPVEQKEIQNAVPGAPISAPGTHPVAQFQQNLADGIARLPGIAAVGFSSQLPLSRSSGRKLSVKAPGNQAVMTLFYYISGTYLQTMRIPLIQGRYFDENETLGGHPSVIINESLARRFWAGSDALGQKLKVSDASDPREVVGVVGDVRQTGLPRPVEPQIYLPYLQPYRGKFPMLQMTFVIRTDLDPQAVVPSVRDRVGLLEKDLAVFRVRTMEDVVSDSISAYRFRAGLFGSFASLGLLLATFGVFAVVAFMVKARAHEIGVRIALGAGPGQILAMVLRHAALLGFLGVIAGSGAAIVLTRFAGSLLYGVEPLDTQIFVGSAVIVFSAALLACLAPAVVATRVDPVTLLRHE